MPDRPWVMTQSWHDLLFAHWAVDPRDLAGRIPAPFEIDVLDGAAWMGIVPFRMSNVSARGVPNLPGLSAFAELNVRTFVRVGGRPGVFFFSLDAANRIAVRAARLLFNLPYWFASISIVRDETGVRYRSHRIGGGRQADFEAAYAPLGPASDARRVEPGSLDYFLTERYCLYQIDHRGRPYRLEIHHPPWRLRTAVAEIQVNTMAEAVGLRLPATPPVLHFVNRQDVVSWMPQTLATGVRA